MANIKLFGHFQSILSSVKVPHLDLDFCYGICQIWALFGFVTTLCLQDQWGAQDIESDLFTSRIRKRTTKKKKNIYEVFHKRNPYLKLQQTVLQLEARI